MNQPSSLARLAPILVVALLGCQSEPSDVQIERGEQLLADGRNEEAISLFEEQVAAHSSSATACRWLARAYAVDDQASKAVTTYEHCLELDTDDDEARVALAQLLSRLNRLPDAQEQLQIVLENDPGQVAALHLLGDILVHLTRYDEAIKAYQDAAAIAPDVGNIWDGLGEAQMASGHLDEAEAAYRQAIVVDPGYADHHVGLGLVLFKKRSYAEAAVVLKHAIELDSLNTQAHFNLGNTYLRLNRPEEGQHLLQRYRELYDQERRIYGIGVSILQSPDRAELYHDLGVLHTQRGETEQARKRYIQAVARDTNFAPSYHNLGTIMLRQDDLDEAMGLYRRALRADSSYIPAYRSLGNVYMRQQHVEAAVETFRAGLRFEPDNQDLRQRLALAQEALPLSARVVARIGDTVITIPEFEGRVRAVPEVGRQLQAMDLETRHRLLDGIIAQELLLLEGQRQGLETEPAIASALARQERRALLDALYETQALLGDYTSTEAELRTSYHQDGLDVGVLARHIICATRPEAQAVIDQLSAGASFDSLLVRHTLPAARQRFGPRGTAGWVRLGDLHEALREPLSTMPVGTISTEPVQTNQGYDVFMLDARRPVPFESSVDYLRERLRRQKRARDMAAYVGSLREKYALQVDPGGIQVLRQVLSRGDTSNVADGDETVATWNGGRLSVADYVDLLRAGRTAAPASQDTAALRRAVDNHVGVQVMVTEARRLGLDRLPLIRRRLENQRGELFASILFQRGADLRGPNDAAAMDEYINELRRQYADEIEIDVDNLARTFSEGTRP